MATVALNSISDQKLIEEILSRGYQVVPREGILNFSAENEVDELYIRHARTTSDKLNAVAHGNITVLNKLFHQIKSNDPISVVTFGEHPGEDGGRPVRVFTAHTTMLIRQDQLNTDAKRKADIIARAQQDIRKRIDAMSLSAIEDAGKFFRPVDWEGKS